ncbi:hypothetical protein OsI_22744 [Oryza sativa Indica Group]|uniref:Uncharacterized protein n=5 Tax=Oryza TaxID=4527 RepID=A0A8J8YG58_ORYSJ|nr:hypothetical protein OsI_22744 [Oryza sativa Indica Group]EAZ36807.1 hypothetical protein OsJ_21147 [Oryza sativa Japonica Group]KAF2926536.1 hypothetical protein DAI22_06g134800 [Oryza sativa Japonica Group]BAG88282.1 unnamed protein product [Oryza sativa Japonica Group]
MAPRVAVLLMAVASSLLVMASAQEFNAPASSPAPSPMAGAAPGSASPLAVASSALVTLLAAALMQ